MRCWMLRQTSSAAPAVMNGARRGRTLELAATIGRCRPAPGKLISRSRSYGDRPSRRQSLNVIAGGRARSRSSLIEMYLAGISVRRVEDITEALWGTRVSPSTVSNLNKKIYAKIEAWRNRRIEGETSVPLSRRHRDEANLGRRSPQCFSASGQRRQFGGFSEKFLASAKAPRRTSLAGRRSCATWSTAALPAYS